MLKRKLAGCSGGAAFDVLAGAAVVIFVLIPLFAAVAEKYLFMTKIQAVRDAVDLTNIALYNALDIAAASQNEISMDDNTVYGTYCRMLAANLNLNYDLSPGENSLVEDTVTINSLAVYLNNFPVYCPEGVQLTRPSVHVSLTIPVRPGLFREYILNALGRIYIDVKMHMDTDIPVNN